MEQVGGVVPPQFLRQQLQQPVGCRLLHLFVRGAKGWVVIFDGGGQVTGQNFRGIVVKRQQNNLARVDVTAEVLVLEERQGVRQDGHHVGVLLDVLRLRVAHERPALDVAHPSQQGIKMTVHGRPPFSLLQ